MTITNRREFIKQVGIGACLLATSAQADSSAQGRVRKPNVLFILTDDQRKDTIGALGNPHIKTPNLDALVHQGVQFTHAYCMGGFSAAVCLPSRMMTLRGRAWFSVQHLPKGFPNLPTAMNDAGYHTCHIGKKGNTDTEVQAMFNEIHYVKPKHSRTEWAGMDDDQQARLEGIPGEQVADGAIAYLRNRDRSKPFFMYLAGPEPHDPRVAPQQYLDMYDPEKIPLPPNFQPYHPFDNGDLFIRDEKLAPWPRTEQEIRRHLQAYYADITYMDEQFGRIFQTLKDLGEYDNTIIIFSSDQGIAIGSHGLMGKQNLYEHSMGVPLIMAGPGIPKDTKVDTYAYLFDVFPTICDLTGTPVPPELDGRSLKPALQGGTPTLRDGIFLAYRDIQRAVIQEGWKLIRYPRINKTQLFHLESDPYETCDLSDTPEYTEKKQVLMNYMQQQQAQFGDTLPLSVDHPRLDTLTLDYFKTHSD